MLTKNLKKSLYILEDGASGDIAKKINCQKIN